jgi:hypothetical protein
MLCTVDIRAFIRSRRDRARLIQGFRGSQDYWEQRYASGGSSGVGSYDELAAFKADFLNQFVNEQSIASVIEFGCGDGNQLSLSNYPRYIGLDVSRTALERCQKLFRGDPSKSFFLYDPDAFVNHGALGADLVLSLDVIYHLVEDRVFTAYITHLFEAASRYVIIYASNEERQQPDPHVRHRRFTDHVERHVDGWTLAKTVVNPHKGHDSPSDFYVYSRDSGRA